MSTEKAAAFGGQIQLVLNLDQGNLARERAKVRGFYRYPSIKIGSCFEPREGAESRPREWTACGYRSSAWKNAIPMRI